MLVEREVLSQLFIFGKEEKAVSKDLHEGCI